MEEENISQQPPVEAQPQPMAQKKPLLWIWVIVGIVIVLILGGGAYAYLNLESDKPAGCTAEAKICPDGSSVGRVPPACEFAECPKVDETSNWQTYTNEEYGFEFKYPSGFGVSEQPMEAFKSSFPAISGQFQLGRINVSDGEEVILHITTGCHAVVGSEHSENIEVYRPYFISKYSEIEKLEELGDEYIKDVTLGEIESKLLISPSVEGYKFKIPVCSRETQPEGAQNDKCILIGSHNVNLLEDSDTSDIVRDIIDTFSFFKSISEISSDFPSCLTKG